MARQGEGGCRVPPAVQEFSGSRSPGRASLEPQDRWCALLLPIRRSLRKGDGGGGGGGVATGILPTGWVMGN